MQGLDRPGRDPQGGGDLLVPELAEMAHHEDRSLTVCQTVQAAVEDVADVALPAAARRSGVRQVHVLDARPARPALQAGLGPPEVVDAKISGDLEEPGLEAPPGTVGIELLVEPEECLLDQVQGVLPVAEERVAQGEDFLLMHPHELPKGRPVSGTGGEGKLRRIVAHPGRLSVGHCLLGSI